jgi:hypothetical protein
LFGVVLVYVVAIIPFAVFYYDSEDPDKGIKHQILWGTIYSIISIVLFLVVFGITYYWLGKSYIPYNLQVSNAPSFEIGEATYVKVGYNIRM